MTRPLLLVLMLLGTPVLAAPPLPDLASLAQRAAGRFSQPVRVGSLLGRDVLEPRESQPVLGRVEAIVRRGDGRLDLVMRAGGLLGFGGRLVAVPLDAVALLGEHVAVIDYTPEQVDALPTAVLAGGELVGNAEIRMGIVRPFH